jgi:hypothetical protein
MGTQAAASAHQYCYKALETARTIRLIIIHPGKVNDDIHLDIQHRHLDDDATAFEALSYVWGSPEPHEEVFINGIAFNVGPNLFCALHHLRYRDKRRVMWIDAVAINQEDLQEKNIQLPLMRYIYPLASSTVVFVGEADSDTAWAFNCFEMLHALYCFWYENPKAATQRGLRYRIVRYDLARLFQFFNRDWFERAWTFQEICLSAEVLVVCGDHKIPWTTIVFAIAAVRLGSDGTGLVDVKDRVLARIEYWALSHLIGRRSAPRQFSMTTLLSETRGLATTNARDRIYSVMGMAEIGRSVVQPDYTLSVAATYILATRRFIMDDNGLRVFQQLDRPEPANDLPSWVPDWRQNQRGVTLVQSKVPTWLPEKSRSTITGPGSQGLFYDFNASHIAAFADRPISDKPKLSLTGAAVDVIEAVHQTHTLLQRLIRLNNNAATTWRLVFCVIRSFLNNLTLPDQSEEPNSLAMLRVLCADRLPISKQRQISDGIVPEHVGHYKRNTGFSLFRTKQFDLDSEWIKNKYLCMWNEASQEPEVPSPLEAIAAKTLHITKMVVGIRPDEDEEMKRSRIAKEYCSTVCGVLHGRALVVTCGGRIGLAPDRCQAGDHVFSLLGGDVPYILRAATKVTEYSILGEAYVHGTMDGELWTLMEDGSLQARNDAINFANLVLV